LEGYLPLHPPTSGDRRRGTQLVMLCTQVPRRLPRRSLQTAEARHPGDSPVATRYYPRAPLVLRVVSFTRERRRSFHPPAPAQDRCRSYSPIRARPGDLNPPAHAERLDLRHHAAQAVFQRTRAHGRLYPSESRPTVRSLYPEWSSGSAAVAEPVASDSAVEFAVRQPDILTFIARVPRAR
jgi:hypothetical protein